MYYDSTCIKKKIQVSGVQSHFILEYIVMSHLEEVVD